MGNSLVKISLLTVAAFVLLFLFIRFIEKKSLYFPFRKIEATPKDAGLDYEEVMLRARDGVHITGWYIPARKPRATVLFFHGNGGNISHRLEKISMLNFLGLNVLIFDYRGYGKSSGSPSEKGLYLDAAAVYEYLLKERKVLPEQVIAYGESLGAAVAVELAVSHEIGGMIIEEGFTSVKDMAREVMPLLPAALLKSEFDSLKKIRKIKVPILIFHSRDDEIVPFRQGRRLYEDASEPKEFVQLHGGHNDAFLVSQEEYMGSIDAFISRLN